MRRIVDKERLLQAKVSFKDVLTAKNKSLLKQYYFDDLILKTTGTQGELDKLYELIEQLEELEWLKIYHTCKFTKWECALLIKEGYFENLRMCIESNCIASKTKISGYELLKDKIEQLVKEKKLKPIVPMKITVEKTEEVEVVLDTKKLTKVINYINKQGGLTKEEMKFLVKHLGFKFASEIRENLIEQENKEEKSI